MTRQESFKRRIRARMATTGERYTAARQALLDQAPSGGRRRSWVVEPEVGEEAVRSATGRGWDDWVDCIEAWDGRTGGHAAIASSLATEHGVEPWWSQTITVGYERITGTRLPYQRPDGTFTAGKSRTVAADTGVLRAMLLDDRHRGDLFPRLPTELRSDPAAKAIRIAIGPGVAVISLDGRADGRTKVTVAHERLPAFDDVEEWKFYWSDWLDAIDGEQATT